MDQIHNDQDFEDFLRENSEKLNNFFLLLTIREKMRSSIELFRITNESLAREQESSSLMKFRSGLIESINQTLEQFNFLIADSIEEDEDEDDEPE